MLLRQQEQHDTDIFGSMGSHQENLPVIDSGSGTNDLMDDIFGSAPPSPGHEPSEQAGAAGLSQQDQSDVRRLEREHFNSGYRDGITAAKGQSIQAGFDEGFGLGATIGSEAGQLLGILEGLASALRDAGGEASSRASGLLAEATRELSIKSVYSEAYWHEDGTWKYDVEGEREGRGDESVVLFSHVAASHPLIKKWTVAVEAEIQRWGIDRSVLGDARTEIPEAAPKPKIEHVQSAKDALKW